VWERFPRDRAKKRGKKDLEKAQRVTGNETPGGLPGCKSSEQKRGGEKGGWGFVSTTGGGFGGVEGKIQYCVLVPRADRVGTGRRTQGVHQKRVCLFKDGKGFGGSKGKTKTGGKSWLR